MYIKAVRSASWVDRTHLRILYDQPVRPTSFMDFTQDENDHGLDGPVEVKLGELTCSEEILFASDSMRHHEGDMLLWWYRVAPMTYHGAFRPRSVLRSRELLYSNLPAMARYRSAVAVMILL